MLLVFPHESYTVLHGITRVIPCNFFLWKHAVWLNEKIVYHKEREVKCDEFSYLPMNMMIVWNHGWSNSCAVALTSVPFGPWGMATPFTLHKWKRRNYIKRNGWRKTTITASQQQQNIFVHTFHQCGYNTL